MRVYDLAPTKAKYYRQTNNEISPGVTCKPTSTVMGLDLADWPPPTGSYRQPEDNLTAMCRSDAGKAVMLAIDPRLEGTPPNEVWGVIAWAINEVFYPKQRPLCGPHWDWRLQEALFSVVQRIPFIASTWLSRGGHVVSIAGYETEQEEVPANWSDIDLAAVKSIIIDDPYGFHTVKGGYDTSRSGYHNRYTLEEWKPYWRGIGIQIRRYAD